MNNECYRFNGCDWVYDKVLRSKCRVVNLAGSYSIRCDIHVENHLVKEFDPIPITPEILEKNFEKKTYYGIFDDYYDFEIREYNEGMYIINYHSCEMAFPPTQIFGICFVHELQHCLALLGIDRQIELPEED